MAPSPGTVPDNNIFPGIPLIVTKAGANLNLAWGMPGGSCQTADYGIYRGNLPFAVYDHRSIICTTGGLTFASILADSESYYYLVVAQSNNNEGSYGLSSDDLQRPSALIPCKIQEIGNCN